MPRIPRRRRLVLRGLKLLGIWAVLYIAFSLWEPLTRYNKHHIPGTQRDFTSEPHFKGIPKIIHQVWKGDRIPALFHDNIRGLVDHNKPPEWTYFFWTDQSGYELINRTFPRLLRRYKEAVGVLKGDIIRLVVLYLYGGVYFDLDTVSVKPLTPYVETHTCSLVTDPPEHTLTTAPKPVLLITNSAMLCKPFNWFILHIIRQLEDQPSTCRNAEDCTGPRFISRIYESFQTTNKSADLPLIEDYRLFEDMIDAGLHGKLNASCREPFPEFEHEWARDICRNYINRGPDKRKISEKAFTYHTWYHTYQNERRLKADGSKEKKISELVPNVTLYNSADSSLTLYTNE